MKKILFTTCLLLGVTFGNAQHLDLFQRPEMYKGKQMYTEDTTSLLSAFKMGQFNGHFRYFFMYTQNQKGLTNYYANAAGGGLRYETAKFHGFQFAASGFYTFNIGSSDFGKADATTGLYNRYEIALFDVENPYNKKDNDRLEEFYIMYNYKKSFVAVGKQLVNTPFINLQDGRMRPTAVEGFWVDIKEIKKTKLEGGWLFAISPRGTNNWFTTGESIGIYPVGVTNNGNKSQYANNLKSNGVFLFGAHINLGSNIHLHGWNVFTENIFNTSMLQADYSFRRKGNDTLFASAQCIQQNAMKNGGNKDAAKTYFEKGEQSRTFGLKAGWKNKQWGAGIHYNRITAQGRYLMPREWGREPFFTFLPRERNEGFGDVHAFMGKVNYRIPKARVKASLAAGIYKMPDVKNFRLNKYGLPSYTQLNIDIRYAFQNTLNGLDAQLLLVGKWKNGETYNNKKFEFNKVDLTLYNLVVNYHF